MGVASSKGEIYTLRERATFDEPFPHVLYDATRADGQEHSIFSLIPKSSAQKSLADNLISTWKRYRHPTIADFLEEYEENGIIYVVTERLVPFDMETLTANEVLWSLNNMAEFVYFFGEVSSTVHGFFRRGALFLTPGKELKVSGFFWATKICGGDYGSIDQFKNQWKQELGFDGENLLGMNAYAVDCRSIGLMMEENIERFPNEIRRIIKNWCGKNTIPPSKLLKLDYWENDCFVQYLKYLKELPLKDTLERDEFYKRLRDNISLFDDETQKLKILPQLIYALSFSPSPNLLALILTIGKLLDESKFAIIIVPPLVALFDNKDKNIRLHLLNQIDSLVPFLEKNIVNSQIFTNIISGINDSVTVLKQATIVAMVSLAQFLTQQNMNTLIKGLKQLQLDKDPQIRTNAVICIAKIAKYIDDDSRCQILIYSFSIAARDHYVPSKKAAIAAYKSCIKYFTNIIIATSIIPCIGPLCADNNIDVKNMALSAMQIFIDIIKESDNNENSLEKIDKIQKHQEEIKNHQNNTQTSSFEVKTNKPQLLQESKGKQKSNDLLRKKIFLKNKSNPKPIIQNDILDEEEDLFISDSEIENKEKTKAREMKNIPQKKNQNIIEKNQIQRKKNDSISKNEFNSKNKDINIKNNKYNTNKASIKNNLPIKKDLSKQSSDSDPFPSLEEESEQQNFASDKNIFDDGFNWDEEEDGWGD